MFGPGIEDVLHNARSYHPEAFLSRKGTTGDHDGSKSFRGKGDRVGNTGTSRAKPPPALGVLVRVEARPQVELAAVK